jgi:sulfoxide reductase heme-binding subunit YedZ
MTFRGLHPATRPIRWGLLAIAVGIVLGSTGPSAIHGLAEAWSSNRAILPWVFERLFAFLAYGAMTGSVVYGLLLSTKILDTIAHRPISFALHQDLASIGLGFAAIHGTLLALDSSIPFTLAQIAVPGLAPYAPLAVALGQVTLYLMAVVVGSFYLRRRIGQRTWRALHYLTFLAFVGATIHGIAAGTDSATPGAWWLYVGSTTAVVFLLTYRIALSIAGRIVPERPRAAVPTRTDTVPARAMEPRPTSAEPSPFRGAAKLVPERAVAD